MARGRVLYLGDSNAMDENSMIGFSPEEVEDLLEAVGCAVQVRMPGAESLREKIIKARDQ